MVFWLLGRALRPVKPILRGLSEMERGRLDTRLPGFSLPEFPGLPSLPDMPGCPLD